MIWNYLFSFIFFLLDFSSNLIWFEMFSIINTIITVTITLPNWLWYTQKMCVFQLNPFHSVDSFILLMNHGFSCVIFIPDDEDRHHLHHLSCAYSCCFFIFYDIFFSVWIGLNFSFRFWLTNQFNWLNWTNSTNLTNSIPTNSFQ